MKPLNNTSIVKKTDKLTLKQLMRAVNYVKENAQKQRLVKD